MAQPWTGPARLLDTIKIIAANRMALVSELLSEHNSLIGLETLPGDQPVSGLALQELISSLAKKAPALYERNKEFISSIKPLPNNWMILRFKLRVLKSRKIKGCKNSFYG